MGEPLKNKGNTSDQTEIKDVFYYKEDIKSSVEWLKEKEVKLLERYWLKEIDWTQFKTELVELKDQAFPDLKAKGGR